MINPQSTIRNPKWKQGFTLIELALVSVVMAALMLAVLPRFQDVLQRSRVERAAFALAQMVRVARARAVTGETPIVWVWAAEERRVQLAQPQPDGTRVWLEEAAARSRPVEPEVTVAVTREGATEEAFTCFPDGTCEAAVIDVVRGSQGYEVSVQAATGQPTVAPWRADR